MLGMPLTLPFPTWLGAVPGMPAIASHLLNKEMERLDIPPVREFLELIFDSGGKIFACKLAMDMFGRPVGARGRCADRGGFLPGIGGRGHAHTFYLIFHGLRATSSPGEPVKWPVRVTGG